MHSATGPVPGGGSERLDWQTWDVQQLAGREAVIQILDRHTGGWGHINVDHIVQSDTRLAPQPASRELTVAAAFLNLPVVTGNPPRHMRLVVDGKVAHEFDIELADETSGDVKPAAVTFYAPVDMRPLRGRKLRIEVDALPAKSQALDAVTLDDQPRAAVPIYHERLRPQFHFTSQRGWLNDPNGLVYCAGQWHLFYQHNPYGWNWGNMHWGHAVSEDLVKWRELPDALRRAATGIGASQAAPSWIGITRPDSRPGRGTCWCWPTPARAAASALPIRLTRAAHGANSMAILWCATPVAIPGSCGTPTKRWVMAVYDELDGKQWIAFYTSPDLKVWQLASRIEGFFECPDLFEISIDDNPTNNRWILYAADGRYVVGSFDGRTFTVDSGKHQLWHGNFYAAQTFSNAPAGRRVHIGWGQGITFPGMPFNQQMTVPVELKLRTTKDGPRLFAWPVEEIESLRTKLHTWEALRMAPGENPLAEIRGEQFDIEAEIEPLDAASCDFLIRGIPVTYDAKHHEVTCGKHIIPLAPVDGLIRLHILADRGSIELFGNGGQVALSAAAQPVADDKSLAFVTRGGEARLRSLTIYELRSAW